MQLDDLAYFDNKFKHINELLNLNIQEKKADITQKIIEDVIRKIFIRVNCDIIFTIEMYSLLKGCSKDQADEEVNEFLNF